MAEKKYLIDNAKLMAEWNWDKNNDLYAESFTLGSNKKVWWKCEKGHEWQASIANRNQGRGCPVCSNKMVVKGKNDLATTNPELVSEWDFEFNGDITPYNVTHGSGKKVGWICPNGHKYTASILHRTNGKTGCPICFSGRQTSFAEQAILYYFKKNYPDAISRYKEIFNNGMELDIYIPSLKIGIEYDGVYWHKNNLKREKIKYEICKKNNIYLIRIKENSKNMDAFETADEFFGMYNLDDIKNLENLIKFLIEKIERFNTNYNMKFPQINLKKDEFEIRSYMTKLKGNSLQDEFPELSKEWNYEKNGGLLQSMFLCGSSQEVWWKCSKCSHEWKTAIYHRAKNKTGCRECYKVELSKNKRAKSKPIFQYDLDGFFIKKWDCIADASENLSINQSNISMCAKNKRNNAGGFRWSYELLTELPSIVKKKRNTANMKRKEVLQIDLNGNIIKKYNSVYEAAKSVNLHPSNISKAIHKTGIKAGGYFWKSIE